MTTTSLKLPDDVKANVLAAAGMRGMSAHAFMVEAIRDAASAASQRESFIADAKQALKEARESGMGYDAHEVHQYIRDKIAGKPARKPKAKSWRG